MSNDWGAFIGFLVTLVGFFGLLGLLTWVRDILVKRYGR